jgi:Ser/Thr protein kinase RdoA (MazF antagonist)
MKNNQEKLISTINSLYDFNNEVSIQRKINQGYLTENHILGNKKEKFFLKKYRSFGLARLEKIQKVKKFFAEKGIPAILPLENKNKKTLLKFERNFYSIFPYAKGRQIKWSKLSDEALKSCGVLLANIHLQSKGGHPGLIGERPFAWNREKFLARIRKILRIISRKKIKTSFDKKAEKFILRKIYLAEKNAVDYSELGLKSDHLIHGDFHEENMFFDSNNQIKYIFDWEKTNTSPRAVEIARAMEFLCFYGSYKNKNFRKAKIFLKEYNKAYLIKKKELEKGIIVWYLNQVHSRWILEEHYLKKNNRTDCLLANHIKFLNYYSKNLEKHWSRLEKYV